MENANKNLEFRVGVFVSIGLLLLGLSIMLLGGDRMLFTRYYYLKTELSQVQGLVDGSIVSLAGMSVGNVAKIQFLIDRNILQITLKIDRKFQDRIRDGSSAEIKTQGALGDKFIYINPGPLTGTVLADNAMLAASDGPDFFSVIASHGDALNQVFDVLKEVGVLMKNINGQGRSQHIMENLSSTTSSLRSTVERINGLLSELQGKDEAGLRSSLMHLSHILKKIDDGDGSLGALINDPSLHEGLKQLIGGSSRQRYLKSFVRDAIQTNEKQAH